MKNRVARISVAAVLAFGLISPAWASASPRPVAAEDLFKLAFVSDTRISPDARYVAFVVERMNGPNNEYRANLWLADLANGAVRQITHGNHDDAPAWSPDGSTLAFVRSQHGARPQIFAYRMAGGATTQLTRLTGGASNPLYSHSGKFIVFRSTAKDPQHAAYVDFARAGFAPKKKERTSDVRFISHMHFESNGAGYVYGRHAHIWRMNADGSHVVAVTSGRFSETNVHWSPDDRLLAFDSLRSYSPSLGPGDVYTISSSGGTLRRMESAQPANTLLDFDRHGNVWVASGGYLDPAEYPAVTIGPPDGSAKRTLIATNTVAFGDIVLADMGEPGGACGPLFAPGDAFAVTNVNGPGYSKLVKLDPASGRMTDVTGSGGEAAACSLDASGEKIAYTYSDFTHPREVYVLDLKTGKRTRVSSFNDAYLSSVTLSQPQPFTVKDDAGFDVHAWFMPATGGKPTAKHPTLLDIHGGPQTQFGETFFHEFQVWTSLGYNVVFCDPRGSVGFGYDFQEALAKHWGDAMFADVQAVMDRAVRRADVDPDRLGVLGGSYGGYATLWVIAHTHRYRAAIAERVVSNLATEQLAADLASDNALGGRYSWGLPWQPGNLYLEQSPISYVANVNTPLLLLHSELDTRTPIDQTLQEFSALQILGKTVSYIDFPGENHDLSRTGSPIHRVERLNALAQWFAQYFHP